MREANITLEDADSLRRGTEEYRQRISEGLQRVRRRARP